MKILFLCTAHNSLSQRLYLELSSLGHDISIECALSDETMLEAVALFGPDLVLCPFLTTRVPIEVYSKVLTLIIHPGPPGDSGPSAIDWLLMGDDGSIEDASQALKHLNSEDTCSGRSHWGITVLEAIEDFDAGPVWAFQQFPIDIDQAGLTKSELYRGPITRAAVSATRCAIDRVQLAARGRRMSIERINFTSYSPNIRPDPSYGQLSVTDNLPFQGSPTRHRPLLKAAQREFDLARHTVQQISRRIRCADSQPGVLSKVFGRSLYVYGGTVEDSLPDRSSDCLPGTTTKILGTRNDAICLATCDGKGVWITHVRRPKGKEPALWPKVPAVSCLLELGILDAAQVKNLHWPSTCGWTLPTSNTHQEIWVQFVVDENLNKTAYLHFNFYNGAMSTGQCSQLIDAMNYILSHSTTESPVHAVALMGGSYFSNGIALNVIEAAADPAQESWLNINRINDVVHYLLHEFPARGILTFAAVRGNAAAGGVALAAACDFVIAGAEVVLNPAYRAIGLHGSEYHSISYSARCGESRAKTMLREMLPMSPLEAQQIGLIDYVFPGTGEQLDDYVRTHITMLLKPRCLKQGFWKRGVDLSPSALARARAVELSEMSKDFWSSRSVRYHDRRFDFVRKVKPSSTPLRFAKHRQLLENGRTDIEETDQFDDVTYFRKSAEEQLLSRLRDEIRAEMGTAQTMHVVSPGDLINPAADRYAATKQTLFSCYYTPIDTLTPPLTPVETSLETSLVMGEVLLNGLKGRSGSC